MMIHRPAIKMKRWKTLGRRFLIAVAIIYAVICVGVCIWQRSLLYFPYKIPADAVMAEAKKNGFIPWKNPAGETIGWEITADTNSTGSVLVLQGNSGCAFWNHDFVRPIHSGADVNVFILEYPGYGARPGSPSRKIFDAAAEEAFQLLPKNLPRYVVSMSLGTGVAGDIIENHPAEIAGVAMFAPYHNLAWVVQHRFWFLPVYLFLLDRFNPEECLKNYHGPIKFVVAGDDEIIGAASGLRLENTYQGPKDLELFPYAQHADVAFRTSDWWHKVFSFWQKNAVVSPK